MSKIWLGSENQNGLLIDQNLNYVCEYKDGQRHGLLKKYTKSGKIASIYLYQNDKLDGECVDFYGNGNLKEQCFYENGLRHGTYKKFDADGQLKEESIYVNGVLEGNRLTYFDSSIVVQMKEVFVNNNCVEIITYYLNEQIETQYLYVDGIIHGQCREYYEDGVTKAELNYNNGEIVPNSNWYFADTTLQKKLLLYGNTRDEIEYDENGDQIEMRRYVDGKLVKYYKNDNGVIEDTTYSYAT